MFFVDELLTSRLLGQRLNQCCISLLNQDVSTVKHKHRQKLPVRYLKFSFHTSFELYCAFMTHHISNTTQNYQYVTNKLHTAGHRCSLKCMFAVVFFVIGCVVVNAVVFVV